MGEGIGGAKERGESIVKVSLLSSFPSLQTDRPLREKCCLSPRTPARYFTKELTENLVKCLERQTDKKWGVGGSKRVEMGKREKEMTAWLMSPRIPLWRQPRGKS